MTLRRWEWVAVVIAVAALRPDGLEADPASQSLLSVVLNGQVTAAARLSNTLYVAGTFSHVAPGSQAVGTLYALSSTTGTVSARPFPTLDGDISALEPDGAGGYFVAGTFSAGGGLIHVLLDGTVDPAFTPSLNGRAYSLARIGSTLYLSGSFTSVNGAPRAGLAAISGSDGTLMPWIAVSSPPSRLGGQRIVAAANRVIALGTGPCALKCYTQLAIALDATTGSEAWQQSLGTVFLGGPSVSEMLATPTQVFFVGAAFHAFDLASGQPNTALMSLFGSGSRPNALAVSGSTLYAAGSWTSVGGQPRRSLVAVDLASETVLPWNPGIDATIDHLVVSAAGSVVVAGQFDSLSGQARWRLAEIDASGALTPWHAEVFPQRIRHLAASPSGELILASDIVARGGAARVHFAAFDITTGALQPWAPTLGSEPYQSIHMLATDGAQLFTSGTFINGPTLVDRVAAIDPGTGVVTSFPAAPLPGPRSRLLLVDQGWVYIVSGEVNDGALRRYHAVDGRVDPSWAPSVRGAATATVVDTRLHVSTIRGGFVVDLATARTVAATPSTLGLGRPARNGNTVYVTDFGGGSAYDARSLVPLSWSAKNADWIRSLAVIDGRVATSSSVELADAPPRIVVAAVSAFDGTPTPWSQMYQRTLDAIEPEFIGSVGGLLVAGGPFGAMTPVALQGLAVFALDGARAPSNLRARPRGPATEFDWDPPVSPPTGGYVVEASGASGGPPLATIPTSSVHFSALVPPGTYFVRVRTVGASGGIEEVSNEIAVRGGCVAAPPPPSQLTATIANSAVTLSWTAPDVVVDSYTLSAGATSGSSALATLGISGVLTSFSATAPPGTYYLRVRAANACGTSGPSGEVVITVGSADPLPAAPTQLMATVNGATVSFTWTAPAGPIRGYVFEGGSDLGFADLATVVLGPGTSVSVPNVPPGVYVVRVRGLNAAGSGPPSGDVVVRVP